MGLRSAIIVGTTSFLLGALFVHWSADSLTLWKNPVTDGHVRTAVQYYTLLTGPDSFPLPILGALWAVIALGAAALGGSALRGEAGNVMFDGASIFLFVMAGYVYLYEVLPDLDVLSANRSILPAKGPVPAVLVKPVVDLASRHLVCCVLLTGIIVLQASRRWADAEQEAEDAEIASLAAVEDHKSRDSPEIAPRRRLDPQTDEDENDNARAPLRSPSGSLRKKQSGRRAASGARAGRTTNDR